MTGWIHTRRLSAGFVQGCVVLGLLSACSRGPLPEMPEYPPAQPFIEEYQRIQVRKQIYEDYAARQRALAVQRANARNWQAWLRVNRSRELGLDEQAYRKNAERVYRVTNREFLLREWNIHRNRRAYGEALAAQRAEAIARAKARDKGVDTRQFDAIRERIAQQRALEAQRAEARTQALARAQAQSQRVFEENRGLFEARRQPPPEPPRNAQGQRITRTDPQEQAQYAAALTRREELRRAQAQQQRATGPALAERQAADRAAFAELQERIREGLARQQAAASQRNRQQALQLLQRQQAFGLATQPQQGQGGAPPAQQAPAVIDVQPPVQQQAAN